MPLRLHAISRWCYLHKISLIPRVIQAAIHLLFKCILPPECSIGAGTRLYHHGWCIGLHPNVEIGRDCNIHSLVEITSCDSQQTGSPVRIVIRDRVNIYAGAKVLCDSGTLTVGEGSIIGHNAVVESDVPPGSLVTGVPARCSRLNSPDTISREQPVP